jgi:hypothetical protein
VSFHLGDTIFATSLVAEMGEDLMACVLSGMQRYSRVVGMVASESEWFENALRDWLDEHERAPPGTSRVDLEKWILNEKHRAAFLRSLDWIEQHWPELVGREHYEYWRKFGALDTEPLRRIVATADLSPVETSSENS